MSAETLNFMAQEPDAATPVTTFVQGRGTLLDVRSPAEFAQGHVPGACNLPLFSDAERAEVGTTYKQLGRNAAVALGLELIGPRLAQLGAQLQQHAQACGGALRLYCWRGGMRSGSMAWLARTLDLQVQLLAGGYKSYRRWALACFEQLWPLLLLGGRTGSGKTDLLLNLQQQGAAVIDLEGLAHHRGSSFGGLGQPPQPSTEQFENRLAWQLLTLQPSSPIWLEAESAQVGRCRIPAAFWRQMQHAPVVELQRPAAQRVARLVRVYGSQGQTALQEATSRISKRLGPQRTALSLEAIASGDMASAAAHMLDYYDRCYDHELAQRRQAPLLQLQAEDHSDEDLARQLWQWQQQHDWTGLAPETCA